MGIWGTSWEHKKPYTISYLYGYNVATISFGLLTKARVCEGVGQVWRLGVTFHAPGMWESVREWTPTLPSELPLWELESRWILEFSKNNCRGQNPLDCSFFYIIGKILESKCLKWAHMTHLDTSNTNYGQKKGQESNWQIWFPTTIS